MKTKKILAAIAALAVVCGAVPSQPFANIVKNSAVTANAETSAEDFYIDPRDRRIISYYGSDKDIVIPSGVLSIGNFAFAYNDTLNSVIIPNGVKDIITCAFVCCKNLTSVIIPYSVTDIGEDAFSECDNLTISGYTGSAAETYAAEKGIKFISLGEHDKSKDFNFDAETGTIFRFLCIETEPVIPSEIDGVAVTGIGDYAFMECSDITTITIPDSVTSIGFGAFMFCASLKSVTIPDSVTSIGDGAFSRCSSLTSITIPDSVTSIGSSAFFYCTNLTSVTIPDSVTNIGEKALGYVFNESQEFQKIENFTISGYKGSAAETYAKENEFEFIALDDEPITETELGDVDGDGKITSIDASAALTYYVMKPEKIEDLGFPFNKDAADWDKNGIIDSRDASEILTYYVSHN